MLQRAMPHLALSNSSSERRKIVDGQRQEPQGVENQNRGLHESGIVESETTNGRSEILTVDFSNTEVREVCNRTKFKGLKIIL